MFKPNICIVCYILNYLCFFFFLRVSDFTLFIKLPYTISHINPFNSNMGGDPEESNVSMLFVNLIYEIVSHRQCQL